MGEYLERNMKRNEGKQLFLQSRTAFGLALSLRIGRGYWIFLNVGY